MAEAEPRSDGAGGDGQAGPMVTVRVQYIKDFSFENPGAPRSLTDAATPPQIEVNVDVEAQPMGGTHYEVALLVNASAKKNEANVFVIELVYAALFSLENIPRDRLEIVCLVECPRLLFPFARRVIADTTHEGGFPPLLLDPIDFGKLLRQRRGVAQPSATPPAAPPAAAKRGR